MVLNRSSLVLLGATVFLFGGCSFSSNALWPSLSGEYPARAAQASGQAYGQLALQPSAGQVSGPPVYVNGQQPLSLNSTNFEVQPPRPGVATGTFVGQKVLQLRNDLRRLRNLSGRIMVFCKMYVSGRSSTHRPITCPSQPFALGYRSEPHPVIQCLLIRGTTRSGYSNR